MYILNIQILKTPVFKNTFSYFHGKMFSATQIRFEYGGIVSYVKYFVLVADYLAVKVA